MDKYDGLRGLNENVIVGRLIPRGTGLAFHCARKKKEVGIGRAPITAAAREGQYGRRAASDGRPASCFSFGLAARRRRVSDYVESETA